ncbi:UDP-4-amino-4,6-dideoxy-N-acetyl-beta-L-altrosamine transaminase [Gammaproteobacteria bacterium]|nr:UDP-4-amino-4,6-dideoxy-N-acetyl-beta-L-altrosamine transaminase [Gammaproteobacteria bacterium]
MIPYGKQDVSQDDIDAVVDVLKSDYLTQGPIVPKFEKSLSDFTKAKYSVVVNSATSALHIACKALEVSPGDMVWTSAITFVASANCALYCGANVDFVDIDSNSYNICIESLTKKLELARLSGNLPKVLIPVHLSGQSCDMKSIFELSKEYGFAIIEDASHAIGGMYTDEPVGNCKFSDIAVFSFHPVKIITSGEGGAAMTNNPKLDQKMRLFASHGITRNTELMENVPDGPWYYEQLSLGSNYRMTELQAALGLSQMSRINSFIQKRHQIAKRYNDELKHLPLTLPAQGNEHYSSYHLYIIRLKLDAIQKSHKEIFEELRHEGLGVNLHYIPVYHHPYFKKLGFKKGYCPEAENYYREAISIPIYFGLSDELQDQAIETILKVLSS